MLRLPGGNYTMGSADDWYEKPAHQVSVAPFSLGRFPVTVGEWRACWSAGGCDFEPSGEEGVPVSNVSWKDAQQYVGWLARVTNRPYRLPSEIEWEYAARGGTSTSYWWGDEMITGVATCKGCGEPYNPEKPLRVGMMKANPLGLHDMAGGVAEWVSDCWHSNYHGAPRSGSWDAPNCREHVLRGGSWKSTPEDLRVTSRTKYDTGVRYPTHGLRVALSGQ